MPQLSIKEIESFVTTSITRTYEEGPLHPRFDFDQAVNRAKGRSYIKEAIREAMREERKNHPDQWPPLQKTGSTPHKYSLPQVDLIFNNLAKKVSSDKTQKSQHLIGAGLTLETIAHARVQLLTGEDNNLAALQNNPFIQPQDPNKQNVA